MSNTNATNSQFSALSSQLPARNIIEGKSKANTNDKFAIVVSKFNLFITEKLLDSCFQTLLKNGASKKNIDVIKVPGAFEIPTIVRNLISIPSSQLPARSLYDAIICLGCVIRGETPHFDYICNSVSSEIARLGSTYSVPVIFGIVTAENIDQATERSGGKVGNRGAEAALTAIEMVTVIKELKQSSVLVKESS